MRVTSDNHFDLRRCVPMSREEEHRCAVEDVKTGDPLLAERLIVANMRMVAALARHHGRSDNDPRDMIQEGNRGLLPALASYAPTRGMRFWFGVTRERTRQVEQRLKTRIRHHLRKELGDDFEPPVTGRRRREAISRTIAGASASASAPVPS